jgi:hypothetical protein
LVASDLLIDFLYVMPLREGAGIAWSREQLRRDGNRSSGIAREEKSTTDHVPYRKVVNTIAQVKPNKIRKFPLHCNAIVT